MNIEQCQQVLPLWYQSGCGGGRRGGVVKIYLPPNGPPVGYLSGWGGGRWGGGGHLPASLARFQPPLPSRGCEATFLAKHLLLHTLSAGPAVPHV